jgi:hypothetical protein
VKQGKKAQKTSEKSGVFCLPGHVIGTSPPIPGVRVGEGAAFFSFSEKNLGYFLPLLEEQKEAMQMWK